MMDNKSLQTVDNAVINRNKGQTMSSREIAELTGKQHGHVKRDIEDMLSKLEIDVSKFGYIYTDHKNRAQTEFLLPRRECEILITGYDVVRRAAVIDRWLELEAGRLSIVDCESVRHYLGMAYSLGYTGDKALEFVDESIQKEEGWSPITNKPVPTPYADEPKYLNPADLAKRLLTPLNRLDMIPWLCRHGFCEPERPRSSRYIALGPAKGLCNQYPEKDDTKRLRVALRWKYEMINVVDDIMTVEDFHKYNPSECFAKI